MATAPTPPNPPTPPMSGVPLTSHSGTNQQGPETSKGKRIDYVHLVGHATLLYWWPVWVAGFIFAALTYFEGTRFVHVPNHVNIVKNTETGEYHVKADQRAKDSWKKNLDDELARERRVVAPDEFVRYQRMSHRAGYGTLFCIILLLVVTITNVPLRGLWSVVIIITIFLLSVILMIQGWWDDIFAALGNLRVYIGFAGYLFISIVLVVMWAISTFLYDRQIYIIFTPGQMKVCEEVGSGERVYDTTGMQIEKLRSDLFRHMILGLGFLRWIGIPWGGTGDVTVKTSGAQAHTVEMRNVFNINSELKLIEAMQRERQTVDV